MVYSITQNNHKELIQDTASNLPENIWKIYSSHEEFWKDYFTNYFLKYYKRENGIKLFFWESGPYIKNNSESLISDSYAFYDFKKSMTGNSYLYKMCKHAKIDLLSPVLDDNYFRVGPKNSKGMGLTLLSQENWLVIDLYLTHGLKMTETRRKKCNQLFQAYTIPKLEAIHDLCIKSGATTFDSNVYHLECLNNQMIDFEGKSNGILDHHKSRIETVFGLSETGITLKPIRF